MKYYGLGLTRLYVSFRQINGLEINNQEQFAELAEMFEGCKVHYNVDECRLVSVGFYA
jgi:hypothetical protein